MRISETYVVYSIYAYIYVNFSEYLGCAASMAPAQDDTHNREARHVRTQHVGSSGQRWEKEAKGSAAAAGSLF